MEMSSGNFSDYALMETIKPDEISLQGMFQQHQMLTKTVAQCSQLLWIQQKQIIELRNALVRKFDFSKYFYYKNFSTLDTFSFSFRCFKMKIIQI